MSMRVPEGLKGGDLQVFADVGFPLTAARIRAEIAGLRELLRGPALLIRLNMAPKMIVLDGQEMAETVLEQLADRHWRRWEGDPLDFEQYREIFEWDIISVPVSQL